MSRWSWWAVGFGAYIAFTLSDVPRRPLPCAGSLRPASRSPASAGTLWSGSAASCSSTGFTAEALRWRVRPSSLLLGRDLGERRSAHSGRIRQPASSRPRLRSAAFQRAARRDVVAGLGGAAARARNARPSERRARGARARERLAGHYRRRAQARRARKRAPDSRRQRRLCCRSATTRSRSCRRPAGALAAQFVDNGGPLEVAGTVNIDDAAHLHARRARRAARRCARDRSSKGSRS